MATGNGKEKAEMETIIAKLKAMGCVFVIAKGEDCFSGGASPAAIIELGVDAIEQMVKQHGDFLQASQVSAIAYDVRKLAQAIRDRLK